MKEREEMVKLEEMAHLERIMQLEFEAAEKKLQLAQLDYNGRDHDSKRHFAKTPKLPTFQEGKDDLDAYLGRFERYVDMAKGSMGNKP